MFETVHRCVSKDAYRHVSVIQKSKCTETYKLHTDTSFYVKICIRTRPCKSKICAEARRFTVNKSHIPSH